MSETLTQRAKSVARTKGPAASFGALALAAAFAAIDYVGARNDSVDVNARQWQEIAALKTKVEVLQAKLDFMREYKQTTEVVGVKVEKAR